MYVCIRSTDRSMGDKRRVKECMRSKLKYMSICTSNLDDISRSALFSVHAGAMGWQVRARLRGTAHPLIYIVFAVTRHLRSKWSVCQCLPYVSISYPEGFLWPKTIVNLGVFPSVFWGLWCFLVLSVGWSKFEPLKSGDSYGLLPTDWFFGWWAGKKNYLGIVA